MLTNAQGDEMGTAGSLDIPEDVKRWKAPKEYFGRQITFACITASVIVFLILAIVRFA